MCVEFYVSIDFTSVERTRGFLALERCLLHMDATIMDFGSIVTLLKENEIYTALLYVYASELNDVFNPLEISICQ